MVIFIFTLVPLVAALVIQYVSCRFTMRQTGRGWKWMRLIRLLPLMAAVVVISYVAISRWQIWRNQQVSPLTQILFVPGVPGFFFLLGLFLGWRIWKRRWSPKIIKGS